MGWAHNRAARGCRDGGCRSKGGHTSRWRPVSSDLQPGYHACYVEIAGGEIGPQWPGKMPLQGDGVSAVPQVGVVMGSDSDLGVMMPASTTLTELGIAHEVRVVSAHRTPNDMLSYGRDAIERGLKVIIAGAGGAAHLPGMLAATTTLPVIGVPVPLRHLDGLDSLLSIVQMPSGVPVATVAIGSSRNAALLAARILALADPALAEDLANLAADMAAASRAKDESVTVANG